MWVGMFGLLIPLINASLQQRMSRSSKRKRFGLVSSNRVGRVPSTQVALLRLSPRSIFFIELLFF